MVTIGSFQAWTWTVVMCRAGVLNDLQGEHSSSTHICCKQFQPGPTLPRGVHIGSALFLPTGWTQVQGLCRPEERIQYCLIGPVCFVPKKGHGLQAVTESGSHSLWLWRWDRIHRVVFKRRNHGSSPSPSSGLKQCGMFLATYYL